MWREESGTRLQHCSHATTPPVFRCTVCCIASICRSAAQGSCPIVTLQSCLFFGTRSMRQLFQGTQRYPSVLIWTEARQEPYNLGEKQYRWIESPKKNHIQKAYWYALEFLIQIVLAKHIFRHVFIFTWLLWNPSDKLYDTIRCSIVKIWIRFWGLAVVLCKLK